MKPTKTLPFVSLILIATMIAAPFIFAQDFGGGSFGGYDGSGFSGGSFGGSDPSGFSGGSFGGTDPSGFSGGSFGGFDPSGFSGGSFGGTDSGGFSGGSTTGSAGGSGDSVPGGSAGPGSFDGGSGPGFPGDFPGGPTPGPGPGFPSEHDAVWEDLADVTILRGSPSGTLIQENVFGRCSDPDSDELFFEIASTSSHYELFFITDDIRVFDLDAGFTGGEEVVVTCNGVPESFTLNVVAPGTSAPTPGDDEGDGLSVHIGAIIIPNAYDAMAGDTIPVTISFKNNGDEELENLKAAVAIPDLGVRASVGPLDLKVGKRISKTVYIELPEDAQEGLYYARITIDSGSLHRVKHRDVELIVQ